MGIYGILLPATRTTVSTIGGEGYGQQEKGSVPRGHSETAQRPTGPR